MNKVRHKKVTIICITFVAMIAIMISVSANLSLRLAVFFESPKSAFTMEYKKVELDESKDDTTFYCITKNPPSGGAGNGMCTWVVYSYGPFHYAEYYGEA